MKNQTTYTPTDESDDQNPKFIFSMTATALLAAIANGKIDPVEMAKKELSNRGLDNDGVWIGFKTRNDIKASAGRRACRI